MTGSTPTSGPRFLRIQDVAEKLATTVSQVYALVRSGDLPAIQIGGRISGASNGRSCRRYIQQAYERTAQSLRELPDKLERETPKDAD